MIKKTTRTCLLAAAFGLLPSLAAALDLPPQGQTMDQVRAAHGAPARTLGAIGNPPITRWVYDGYTVYFENSRVIHSVRTQSLKGAAKPAPAAPVVAPAAPAPAALPEPAYEAPAAAEVSVGIEEAPVVPVEEPVVEEAPPEEFPAEDSTLEPEDSAALAAPALAPLPEPEPAAAPAAAPVGGNGFRFDPVTGRLIIDEAGSDEPTAEEAPAADVTTAEEAPLETDSAADDAAADMAEPLEEPAAALPAPVAPAAAAPAVAPVAAPAPAAAAPAAASGKAPLIPAELPPGSGSALEDELEFDPDTGTFRPKKK